MRVRLFALVFVGIVLASTPASAWSVHRSVVTAASYPVRHPKASVTYIRHAVVSVVKHL